jgi:FkbM family methyltransferase
MKNFIKRLVPYNYLYSLGFAVYSCFSKRFPLTIFFRRHGKWFALIKGREIPINLPRLISIEYYRTYIPNPGDVIYDIGGELGLESRQFSLLTGGSGEVHVFECMPAHIKTLKNIQLEYPQMMLHEVACWDQNKILEFRIGNTPGSGTAVEDVKGQHGQSLANKEIESIQVQARRLDDIWRENGCHQVNFLKMDIEGAEYEALDGAKEILLSTNNVAIAAYHIREGIPTAGKVAELLIKSGFKIRVDENLHVYGWR